MSNVKTQNPCLFMRNPKVLHPLYQFQGFLECDRVMRNEESLKDEMAGSTAVVVLTQGNKLWCGCHLLFTVGGVERDHDSDHEYATICKGAQMLGTRVAWRELQALLGEKNLETGFLESE